MEKTNNNTNSKSEYSKGQRIAAMIAVILLAGVIVFAIVAAIVMGEASKPYVLAAVGASLFLGVIGYVIKLFHELSKRKKDNLSNL